MFEIVEKDEVARIGRLTTRHGSIETPALFPVVNPNRQYVELGKIRELGFGQVITNAYIIWRTYGDVARETGVHGVLGWEGVVMTDSGAYQILQYGSVEVNPIDILRYQVEIGSDIGVILDIPTGHPRPRDLVKAEVQETLRRAREALLALRSIDPDRTMLIVGPVQGGTHIDILRYSSMEMAKLPFDIYAIGSPTTLLQTYRFSSIVKMILTAKSILPPGKPIHLFGVGHPLIIPIAVALGIDLFDSASYILYALDNRVILSDRTVRLQELDKDYVLDGCGKRAGEVAEMGRDERIRCIATHNLWVLAKEISEVKQRIREHDIWGYVAEKARQHPSLYRAYKVLLGNGSFGRIVRTLSSGIKVNVPQLRILDNADLARPEVLWARERLDKLLSGSKPANGPLVVLVGKYTEPFVRSAVADEFIKLARDGVGVFMYNPAYGLVPLELSDVYPFSQTTIVNIKPTDSVKVSLNDAVVVAEVDYRGFVKRLRCSGKCVVIYVDSLKTIKSHIDYLLSAISYIRGGSLGKT